MAEISVKPTQRTLAEQLQWDVDHGNLAAIPGLPDRLAAEAAMRRQVDDDRLLSADAKRLHREQLEETLQTDVRALTAEAKRRATYDVGQELGRLRGAAGASADLDPGIATRAQILTAQVAAAADHEAAVRIFDDAAWAGHVDLTRVVGEATVGRLRELAKGREPASPQAVAYLAFAERFGQWRREHPTPRQRAEMLEREIANRARTIDEAAAFMLRRFGFGTAPTSVRRVVEAAPRKLVEGPAFDVLGGRNRTGARR